MKPVSRGRVEEALGRVSAEDRVGGIGSRPPTRPEQTDDEIIPVEHQRGGSTRLIDRSSVLYVQAEGDYVRLHTDSGRFLVRAALSDIEERWGQHGFVRVHRSYVANLKRAAEIRPQLGGAVMIVMVDGSQVPVARRQVADLRRRLRM
jgi:DNA-binding LytR/AlgR family response regulator